MSALLFVFTFFVVCAPRVIVTEEYRTVETNCGQIRGIKKSSLLKNVDYYSFKGIPYAEPPIGELRFKAPEPIREPWSNVLDAFEHGNTCIRPNTISNDDYPQDENCLFLNIYVPASGKLDNKLAVMFWIFGGGFFDGTGNDDIYGPDFLIEKDVILVTINYRVGVFGFLSFDMPEYSGNMGLKDQQLALKWIYENIDQFHGDNKRITVFGDSAGGISAHFHVLSNESRQYFRNAIVMSGTADSIWSLSEVHNHTSLAFQIADALNETKTTIEELIEYFKTIPAEKIKYTAMHESSFYRTMNFKFSPIIEKNNANHPFLVEYPEEIYKKSNIDTDIVFYHTSLEAIYYFLYIYPFMQYKIWDLESNFTLKLPFRNFNLSFESNEYRELAKQVRQFYFGKRVIDESTAMQYMDLISDINFVYPTANSIQLHRKTSNGRAFYIRFSVDSELNFLKVLVPEKIHHSNRAHTPGASHYDAECYLFRYCNLYQNYYDAVLKNVDSEQTKISRNTIEYMTRLFSNFAKHGEPTYRDELISGFQPVQSDVFNYLDISNKGLKLEINPREKAIEFWSQLKANAQKFTVIMCVLRIFLVPFIVCVSFSWTNAVVDDYRTVDTFDGQIRGIRKTTLMKNIDYYSFKGIPYAEPPVGKLRFEPPEPKKPWSPKIHDAFEFGNVCCSETGIPFGDYPKDENCLFLNIYVPAHAKPDNKLAVIFLMHGGGFVEGNGNDFYNGPDFLMEQDVIFVTINYRLGVFGFLSLDTPEYSGNMGLKDQQLALKWVHKNIGHFYGDNKRITCIGGSAGGASCHFHLLSNESRQFIHNAILTSGTAENIWSFGSQKDMISGAYEFAADLGKPQNSVNELVDLLKSVPAEDIVRQWPQDLSNFYRTLYFPIGPVIERSDAKKPFMVISPQKILETSNIDTDIIFSTDSLEMLGLFTTLYVLKQYDVYDLDTNFTLKLPFRYFNFSFESDQYREIANEVRKFYFGDAVINEQMMMEYINLLSDLNFVYPNYKAAKMHQKKSKGRAFYTRFSGDTKLNVFKGYFVKDFMNIQNIPGAAHVDETCYVLRCAFLQDYYDEMLQNIDSEQSKIQLQLIASLTKLHSNFAKYGNPTHNNEPIENFDPIDGNEIKLLDITNDGLQIKQEPRKNAMEFWEKLEEKAQRFIQES
ncbi:uncharacterized protein LOC116339416 [Contarinia nasturtii]|uniref:uncharacterized protein LOC116339416 n=1 Tax=Contarinia nasturtii TaxID=265458 RepID=UPI0012D462CA|nr:uncharacterized protein LOC116339416 [Contarinia nasturtii]